ncbi:nuclease [Rhodobacteraceae bacterium 4F10]|nr:nuclease [Rhodobacteraceae bacterium 4F10]
MKHKNGTIRLSASDLMRFMSCAHASALDFQRMNWEGPDPVEDSADAALLQKQGDEHEAAYLQQLIDGGKDVAVIETDGVPFEQAVAATHEALREGPEAVFQGAIEGGMWGGYSDFLEQVETPSDLGTWSYEVVDTKLKRKPAPGHILQLVLYSDLIAEIQGVAPECAHVQLGNGERFTFRLAEYAAYARAARARLERFVSGPAETRPVPCKTCGLCRWREHCGWVWEQEDSLFQVAGISKTQVQRLEAAGISTMETLSRNEERVPRIAGATLDKLKTQARLQHARKSGSPMVELRSRVEGKGFDLLPEPQEGDLFYDIEGDPFYREGETDGLEYLHGIWDGAAFTALWAHDHAEEKQALISLFFLFQTQVEKHPQARIYHYAPYEITALKRFCTRYGVGEVQLDRWLREGRFVDLYAVVRGGIMASEKSYSIKDMEAFYDIERTGEVKTAGGSVVAYEDWRESGDQQVLDEIEDYNRIDCVSTEYLRDWLMGLRPEGAVWNNLEDATSDKAEENAAEIDLLRDLIDASDLSKERKELLYNLGVFHQREAKPAAWAVFDAADKQFEDLCEDLDCLAGLRAQAPATTVKQSLERPYRYPYQEAKLREGSKANVDLGDGNMVGVTVTALDRKARTVSLKVGKKNAAALRDYVDLLPDFGVNAKPIPAAIQAVIADQCGAGENSAAEDLLSRYRPRFKGNFELSVTGEPVGRLIDAVHQMDGSVLPVQGPPGTGKTYVTARAILSLVRQGKRVGVSSNSHDAIRNVLMGCIDALEDDDIDLTVHDVTIAHKDKTGAGPLPEGYRDIIQTRSSSDALHGSASVVGGTAWLFSREELADSFDYLFIDEAGQVSLANALAMSRSAANLVLVGDPRQLPQVIQGSHPHPANLSCLDWIIGEYTVLPADRGIYLDTTRRMHPALTKYISEQFYAGTLKAHEDTVTQAVDVEGVPRNGAFLVPIDHAGRAQDCPEEIEALRGMVDWLLQGRWTDKAGETRQIRKDDIIVVAPYNAQVNALADALDGIKVGTVDRFQGQEAPIALISMTASSAEETSRGLDFLLSRERLNVAISRAKGLSLVFASPALVATPCETVEQMRLVNALAALEVL